MKSPLEISTVDYHTVGEPFRIVTGGVEPLHGDTVLEKRAWAKENVDHVRQLLINEPRGHADMYGCFVTDPNDADGDLGVVFFHNEGYSTACGHGTIALVTWALENGVVEKTGDETRVVVDAPSGRLQTIARMDGDKVASVRFTNVPSFVHTQDLAVRSSHGILRTDIAFGGAFYGCIDVTPLQTPVEPRNVNFFIALGREVKAAIQSDMEVVHPDEPELRGIYGVIFYEDLPDRDGLKVQRNVTIFADGEVDRSPCGSGTSARLALLDAKGELPRGDELIHLGILNTEFRAAVVGDARVGERDAVITEVEGSAYISGRNTFVLDERDPLGTGFLLR